MKCKCFWMFFASPARSLPAFHTWTLLHSRGSQTARCIGPCIIQLSFGANIYSYELWLHACRYAWFIGCVFWCGWILCTQVYLSALVFTCLCFSVCQSVKTYFEKLLPWLEPAISWLDHRLQESSRVSNFQQLGFKEMALNALAVVPQMRIED